MFSLYVHQINNKLESLATTILKAKKQHTQFIISFKHLYLSPIYKLFWLKFTETAGTANSYILNYYITYQILQMKLQTTCTSNHTELSTSTNETVDFTADEKAAIEYIGGYIIRTVIRKISRKTALPYKNTMLYLVFHLLKDPESTINDSEDPEFPINDSVDQMIDTNGWCKLIDRGGLHQCTKEFLHTLFFFETIIKGNIQVDEINLIPIETIKQKILDNTTQWDECFYYTEEAASRDTFTAAKEELLKCVASEYITLRGFAYAARWMEKYKYNRKSIKKSKGLRNKLARNEE